MGKKSINTGKPFERRVASAYRALGASKVEHDIEIGGSQIDVYVEFDMPDGSVHRIAIDAKDRNKPVGIPIVREVNKVMDGLRRAWLIDEGKIVSPYGFTPKARNGAREFHLGLIEIEDLEAKSGRPDFDVLFQKKVVEMMPDLLAEMRDDLLNPDNKLIREFIPLEFKAMMNLVSATKRRFVYFGDVHPELQNMVDILEDSGFVRLVHSGQYFWIYRMNDDFVQAIINWSS